MGTREITETLYVCVYVPEFPVQALMRLRPDLAQCPVAVVAGDPPLEEVCSANMQASQLGVTQGMTRAELDSFKGLRILRRSEAEERVARTLLLEAAGVYTPRIEVLPPCNSAFVMVLDMTGTKLIFGTAQQAVGRIIDGLTALHFFVQLAASASFHTAVCLACVARNAPIIVAKGAEAEHLRPLSLSVLNLNQSQGDTLTLWGLSTLGELAALPVIELVVRMGQEGKRLRLLARGEHPHLMVPEEPVFTLEEFIAFDAPVAIIESLLFVFGPILDQLLARARNRALALASLTIKLGLDGGGEHLRTIQPTLPTLQREVLLKLLHLDLQSHPPPAGVVSILAHAEPGDRSDVQFGLFAPQLPEPSRLDMTLARIAALVGEGCVGWARLRDSHRPDSFIMERFAVPTSTHRHSETGQALALRRYRPPLPLSIKQRDGRLISFVAHGKQYTVQEAYGPWRRSGDWWSADIWSCEEWDVRATAHVSVVGEETLLCVIVQDLLGHHWHLAGLYD